MNVSALRVAVTLAVAALLAAACGPADVGPEIGLDDVREAIDGAVEDVQEQVGSSDPESAEPADPAPPPAGDEAAHEPDGDGAADMGDGQPGQSPPDEAGADAGGQADDPGPSLPDDRAGIGAMCRPYLRADVPRLVIEIDHQRGAAPTPAAVDHLVGVLGEVLDKPGGISVSGGTEIPGGPRTWTIEEVRAAAAEHRSQHSSPDALVLYVLFLRGEFENPESLGVAFSATEFVVFPDRIGGLSGLLGGRTAVERAVLVHEAGHLLCLINIGYTSDIDHEDPEHRHHSSDRASVMYWAVETSAVARVFTGPPPDTFTANDRADLEGLRAGRY